MSLFLLFFVVVMTASGLTYELLTASLVTSLVGDSVLAFSTIIGTYLFSLGCGAYVSRLIKGRFYILLVQTGLAIGLLGGFSTTLLWVLFSWGSGFFVGVYLLLFSIGSLVGLQLPLIMRALKERLPFKELVSGVLGLDYAGAMLVSVAFPLFLVPQLGLIHTAFCFGTLNVLATLGFVFLYDDEGRWNFLKVEGFTALALLALGVFASNPLAEITEQNLFPDPIIYAQSSSYQRIVVTASTTDTRLYLNNNLQFSSLDEYRYHEALVIPPLRCVKEPKSVLILGGGDGLACKLLLQDPRIEKITLVDLDPAVTALFRSNPILSQLNKDSLSSPKVEIINKDAFVWIESTDKKFDLALVDFPDPSSYSVGKLYTRYFYRMLRSRLNPGGAVSVQSSSPLRAPRSYSCILATLEAADFKVRPYHCYVPSFGEWGFSLGTVEDVTEFQASQLETRFVTDETLDTLFVFSPDMKPNKSEPNTLFDQRLVRYFRQDWNSASL